MCNGEGLTPALIARGLWAFTTIYSFKINDVGSDLFEGFVESLDDRNPDSQVLVQVKCVHSPWWLQAERGGHY